MLRLFTALLLPEDLLDRLVMLQSLLPPGCGRVPRENLHVTLCFIGATGEWEAMALDRALSRIRAAPVRLQVSGTGCFGPADRPRLLWAGVRPSPALTDLHTQIRDAARQAGRALPHRKFVPHVTLGRFTPSRKPAISAPGMLSFLQSQAGLHHKPVTVERFVLMSSQLTRSGPVYTVERRWPLTAGSMSDTMPGAPAQARGVHARGAP